MQNFGQFWNTSDFDREYLQNKATYSESKNVQTRQFLMRLIEKVW